MPLTPADVVSVVFSKPPVGKRGYHEGEVNTFLDLVHGELTRLVQHNDELRGQVEQLRQQLRAAPADPADDGKLEQLLAEVTATVPAQRGTILAPNDDPNVRAAKVLALAQQIADKVTGEVQADVDQMLTQAHSTCQQLLSEAKAHADDLVTQANTRADTMLTEAQSRAKTLDKQARDKAAALEHQATHQHTEIDALRQQKSVWETKIDQLRTFEHNYRTHLATYLQSQLRELDKSQSVTPPHPDSPAPNPVPADPSAQTAPASRS